ncbi:MAG TPA: hypothetical protein P5531_11695 [Bacteroidales bacterium]|nr:hypothetical protein [Bacteroidales bacterium]HSA44227.1 hypothetical protein [Bacteroidales bacterium]
MKKSVMFSCFLLMIAFSLTKAFSQDCTSYMPVKEGTRMEMKHFDAKDKLESSTRMTILKKHNTPDGYAIDVQVNSFDAKGKEAMSNKLTFRCSHGEFIWDMNDLMKGMPAMEGMEDMKIKISGSDLKFPSRLQVGQKLEDAEINFAMESGGMVMMTIKVRIINRKVVAKENITTPAGTFDCYKLSYEVDTESMFSMKMFQTDWIAEETGVVRSENYDQNNKLTSYSLLTELKR